jgi:hypothetical protein
MEVDVEDLAFRYQHLKLIKDVITEFVDNDQEEEFAKWYDKKTVEKEDNYESLKEVIKKELIKHEKFRWISYL